MKVCLILSCLSMLTAVVVAEKYTDKYDNVNVDEILENDRILQQYVDCTMDRGKCTAEGNELKKHLKEALENGCEFCTEKQKAGVEKVFRYLIENKPEMYKELVAKFDPEGKYRKKYEDEARARGIKIPE